MYALSCCVSQLGVHAAPSELLLMQTARVRIVKRLNEQERTPTVLSPSDLAAEGFLVGIDASFGAEVTEAAEIDQDGHKHVLQSSSLALARYDYTSGFGGLLGDYDRRFSKPVAWFLGIGHGRVSSTAYVRT